MWAVPWFRQLVTGLILWRTTSQARPVCFEFVMNQLALGQVFI